MCMKTGLQTVAVAYSLYRKGMKSHNSPRAWWPGIFIELHKKMRHTSCALVVFIYADIIRHKFLSLVNIG